MRQQIVDLVDYVECWPRPKMSLILEIECHIGPEHVFSFATWVIGWLHGQSWKPGPLKLDSSKKFHCVLVDTIKNIPAFNELFQTDAFVVDFRPEISEAERKEIEEYVQKNYHPKIYKGHL